MSFFKKLKDRLFKSSSKIDEGLEAIVHEGVEGSSENQDQEDLQITNDSIDNHQVLADLPPEPEPEPKP